MEAVFRYFADAGDFADGKGDEEVQDLFGADLEQAVGFAPIGGDLGEELVGSDAGGGR